MTSAGPRVQTHPPTIAAALMITPPTCLDSATTSRGIVTWIEPISALSVAIPVDATDNSNVSLDNRRLFLAGALLSIGGGALIGAIQELTHRRNQRRNRFAPQARRAPDAPVAAKDDGAGELSTIAFTWLTGQPASPGRSRTRITCRAVLTY